MQWAHKHRIASVYKVSNGDENHSENIIIESGTGPRTLRWSSFQNLARESSIATRQKLDSVMQENFRRGQGFYTFR